MTRTLLPRWLLLRLLLLLVAGCCHPGGHHDRATEEADSTECRPAHESTSAAAKGGAPGALEPAHDGHVSANHPTADAGCGGDQ